MKPVRILLLLVAYASFVVLGMFDGMLGVAWPSLRAAFLQPVDALGLLLAMTMTGHITASFISGRLITGWGLASLLICSSALFVMGTVTQLLAQLWPVVLVGGLLLGLAMGFLDAGMNTYAASHFRPRLLNWLHASYGLGTSLGALIMTSYLRLEGDWRWGMGTLLILYLVLLLVFSLTSKIWVYRQENIHDTFYAGNKETLRLPLVWISIALFFFYTGIEAGIGFWTFTILTEARGMSEGAAGLLTSLYWISFMSGRVVFGMVESGLTRLIRNCLLFAISGVTIFACSSTPLVSLIGLVITGFSIAPVFPGLVALTPGRVGKHHAPNAIGYQIGAAGLAGAVIPGLAGVLGDACGLDKMVWFFLLVAMLVFLLHELLMRSGHRDRLVTVSKNQIVNKEL